MCGKHDDRYRHSWYFALNAHDYDAYRRSERLFAETWCREIISIFSTRLVRKQVSTYMIGEFAKTDESSKRLGWNSAHDSISAIYSPYCVCTREIVTAFASLRHDRTNESHNTCSAICWHLYILLQTSCIVFAMHRASSNCRHIKFKRQ